MRLGGLPKWSVEWFRPAAFFFTHPMYLLYLDDSGSVRNRDENYFVLGGISVFEAQVFFLTQELDKLAQDIDPANPERIEFHASEIFSRKIAPWNKMTKSEAQGVIKSVLRIAAGSYSSARVFACAVHKASYPGRDPVELSFEDLCSRFDRFLSRLRADGERQRGLLILDKTTYETSLQELAINFRYYGTKWGVIRNLADTPLFIDSKASRVVQIADHVAYAVFRRYNSGDTQYFDIIASKFDTSDGIIHGLAHKIADNQNCMCPCCLSRRLYKEPYQLDE